MGLALVATDHVGSAYHLIEPGENGFRVRANSSGALARAMRAYVNDPTLARRHGTRSLKVFTGFTPERNAQRFLDVIHSWLALERN